MKILILGSTSAIGLSITKKFSKGNDLILVGRSLDKLNKIKKEALLYGAINIKQIEYDLRSDIDYLTTQLEDSQINLFINAASITSKSRDYSINPKNIKSDIFVDLLNPILLLNFLRKKSSKVEVVFLSSFLSKIISPNRQVYSSYKKLQESYLDRICKDSSNNVTLLKVFIGTQFSRDVESKNTIKLAQKIFDAYNRRTNQIFFGATGRIMMLIFYFNPLISRLMILLKRKLFN